EAERKYLNCPDPIEAWARRQRAISGDANGQMDEAVDAMMKGVLRRQNAVASSRESDSNPVTPPPLQENHNQENHIQDFNILDPLVSHSPLPREEDDLDERLNCWDGSPQRIQENLPFAREEVGRLKS